MNLKLLKGAEAFGHTHPGERSGYRLAAGPAMRRRGSAVALMVGLWCGLAHGQSNTPVFSVLMGKATPASALTNRVPANSGFLSVSTLDDKHKLMVGDRVLFRIMEDQEDPLEKMEPKPLLVGDHGEVEVPYIGAFPATGKTCKQLAQELKTELEKEYYYQATVLISLESLSRTTGKVYVMGEVRLNGPVDIPGDEAFSVGKAIVRAGGFTSYADKRRVKVTRKGELAGRAPQTVVIDIAEVLEKGRADKDLPVEPGDLIYVPGRLINF